jgi:hypothetical protein
MWRGKRTDRLTTEDCIALDISKLKRAGVFRAAPGTPCTARWLDPNGKEAFCVTFWTQLRSESKLAFCITYGRLTLFTDPRSIPSQTVELDVTRCSLGGHRYWFVCPSFKGTAACGRRVRVLYLPPGNSSFGCRTCFNLTYQSCQEHDKRVDTLLKLSPKEFRQVLTFGDRGRQILAPLDASSVGVLFAIWGVYAGRNSNLSRLREAR